MAGSIVAKLILDKSGFHAEMDNARKETAKFAEELGKIGKAFSFVGIGITGALGTMLKKTADAGDAIHDLSERTGIAAGILSSYKLAADQSGTSLEGLAIGFRGLSSRMMDAKSDLTGSKRAFDALGVTVTTTSGTLRPLNDVMLDVADKFAGMKDGAEKAALAQDLFGRSGMELIPMLNLGGKGLEESARQAERLGIVFTDKTANAADALNDSITTLKAAFAGIGQQIATGLMPMVTDFAEKVTDVVAGVRGWVVQHGELATALAGTTLKLGAFAVVLGPVLMMLPTIVRSLDLLCLSLGRVGLAFAVAGAAFAAAEWLRTNVFKDHSREVDEVTRKWAILIETSGGWSSIAEAAIRAQTNILGSVKFTLEDLNAVWHKYGENSREAFMAIISGGEGESLRRLFTRLYGEQLKLAGITETVTQKTGELGLAFGATEGPVQTLADRFKELNDDLRRFRMFGVDAANAVNNAFGSLGDMVGGVLGDIIDSVDAAAPGLFDGITGAANKAAKEVENALGRFLSKLQEAVQLVSTTVSGYVNQARTNAEIACENEYRTRLAYINKNVTDEGKRQKAITALEAEYQLKRTAAARKGAILSKAVGLMEATVNTASGVTRAFKDFPFPFSAIIAGIVGALGAIQIALIAAQPVPLAEGATFPKPTLLQNVLVGEKRPEYLLDKPKLIDIVREALTVPRFNVAPAMAGAGGGGVTITMNMNGPLISTTGVSARELEAAGESLVVILDRQLQRVGRRL